MNLHRLVLLSLASLFALPAAAPQTPATPVAASAPTAVPSLVPYSGEIKTQSGDSAITFLIYKDETGGEALWMETQTVATDSAGHYQVQLGATSPNGLPSDLFSTGEARWLEVQAAGQSPQPRVLIASVPYALKAGDATTLGGLPASAYALVATKTATAAAVHPDATAPTSDVTTTGGLAGYIPEFSGPSTIVDSPLFVSGTNLGIGTTTPTATLDVNGAGLFGGALTVDGSTTFNSFLFLSPRGTATTSTSYNSQYIKLETSAYDSSSKAVVNPRFQLQAEAHGNDTASPTGTLNLLSIIGSGTPTETGFSINTNGTLNFAPGQTFPGGGGGGSGTITGVTAGTDLKGGGTTGTVTLNLDTTKIPTLAANNNFAQGATFSAGVSVGSAGTALSGSSSGGYGVFGASATPAEGTAGVFGVTGAGSATFGSEDGNHVAGVWGDVANPAANFAAGIIGTADDANGGAFYNNSIANPTVYAENLWSTASDSNPVAVQGVATSEAGIGIGVYGLGNSVGVNGSGYIGVGGVSTSDGGAGVDGYSTGTDGAGVLGFSTSASTGSAGVYGISLDVSTRGGSVNFASGVWADTSATGQTASLATADEGYAGLFYNNGSAYATIYAENDAASSSTALVFHTDGGHFGGDCKIDVSGNLSCSGTITNVAKVDDGARKVETYSMQSAENWLEDFGTGQLNGGVAHVDLEPVFGETVNTGIEYHVFLTPNGDCKGLYVSTKSNGGFDVHELGGGKSSVTFDYRIVAKRAGYETARLLDVTDQIKEEAEARGKMPHPAIVRPQISTAIARQQAHPTMQRPARPGQPTSRPPQMRPAAPAQQTVITPPAKVAEPK